MLLFDIFLKKYLNETRKFSNDLSPPQKFKTPRSTMLMVFPSQSFAWPPY